MTQSVAGSHTYRSNRVERTGQRALRLVVMFAVCAFIVPLLGGRAAADTIETFPGTFESTNVPGADMSGDPQEYGSEAEFIDEALNDESEKNSPEASRYRQASLDAFAGIDGEAATSLFFESFGPQLRALDAGPLSALDSAENVIEFRSDSIAVIEPEEGASHQLVVATQPIRAREGGVPNLDLETEGSDFVPRNPVVPVEISSNADGKIELPTVDVGVTLDVPREEDPEAKLYESEQYDQQIVAQTDVAEDADHVVKPVQGGFETFFQLRSADSPETFEYALDLPDGAELSLNASGGATITGANEKVLVEVLPPYANDAQGTEVPVAYAVEGDNLKVLIDHRGEDLAYPLLVDPRWETYDFYYTTGNTFPGWAWYQTAGSNYTGNLQCPPGIVSNDPCGGTGEGLFVNARPGYSFGAGSDARFYWTPPGTSTYIQNANFQSWRYRKGSATTNYPQAYYGIASGYLWNHKIVKTLGGGGTDVILNGGSAARQLAVGLESPSASSLPSGWQNFRYNQIAYFTVVLDDNENPSLDGIGTGFVPSGWIGPNSDPVVPILAGRDEGLGVRYAVSAAPSANNFNVDHVANNPEGCDGGPTSRCPASKWLVSPIDPDVLSEGRITVRNIVVDAVDKPSGERSFELKIDHSPPKLSKSGALTLPNQAGYTMTLQAVDNELAGPSYDQDGEVTSAIPTSSYRHLRSGAKTLEVYVDDVLDAEHSHSCAGVYASCKIGALNYTMPADNYSEGYHTIRVESKDMVGNKTVESWPKLVDRTMPTSSLNSIVPNGNYVSADEAAISVSSADSGFGVKRMTLRVGGETMVKDFNCGGLGGCPKTASNTFSVDLSNLADGMVPVTLTSEDHAGNRRVKELTSINVDQDGPEVYGVELDPHSNASVPVEVHAANPGSGIELIEVRNAGTQAVIGSFIANCNPECPGYLEETIQVDTSQISVGTQAVVLAVEAPTAVTAQEELLLTIDRSAPVIDTASGELLDAVPSDPALPMKGTLAVEGTDEGGGIHKVEIVNSDNQMVAEEIIAEQDEAAGEQTCENGSCEFDFELPITLEQPNAGEDVFTVKFMDRAGNTTIRSNTATIDTDLPQVEISGTLPESDGRQVAANEQLDLTVAVKDNETVYDTGVDSVTLNVDGGTPVTLGTAPNCVNGCPGAWAMDDLSPYIFDASSYGVGPHTVEITAVDGAGNESTDIITLSPDKSSIPSYEAECVAAPPSQVTNSSGGSVSGAIEMLNNGMPEVLAPTVPYEDPETEVELEPRFEGDVSDDELTMEDVPMGGSVVPEAGGQVVLGTEMCLTPATVSDDNSESELVGDALVVADASPGSDVVIRPNEQGVTMVHQLHDVDASESLIWNIGLDEGETLEEYSTGGIAITREDEETPPSLEPTPDALTLSETISAVSDVELQNRLSDVEFDAADSELDGGVRAVLSTPKAIDANGNAVPVELNLVDGNTAQVNVPASAAYPVTVIMSGFTKPDPEVMCWEMMNFSPSIYWSECSPPIEETPVEYTPTQMADHFTALRRASPDPALDLAYARIGNDYLRMARSNGAQVSGGQDYDFGYLLNEYEERFCTRRPYTCYLFGKDSLQSLYWRAKNYVHGSDNGGPDGTAANAFQHALWIALMTKTERENDFSGDLALHYGGLHEKPDRDARPGSKAKQLSQMDLWNNGTGYGAAINYGTTSHSEEDICKMIRNRARDAVWIGRHNAYNVPPFNELKFVWRSNDEGRGRKVYQRDKAYCPEYDGNPGDFFG